MAIFSRMDKQHDRKVHLSEFDKGVSLDHQDLGLKSNIRTYKSKLYHRNY